MSRPPRVVPGIIALLGLATLAATPASAKVKHRHVGIRHLHEAVRPMPAFPVYVDHGSDYNPGGDNLYFSDTKSPNYIVGPGYFQRWDCTYVGGSGACGP